MILRFRRVLQGNSMLTKFKKSSIEPKLRVSLWEVFNQWPFFRKNAGRFKICITKQTEGRRADFFPKWVPFRRDFTTVGHLVDYAHSTEAWQEIAYRFTMSHQRQCQCFVSVFIRAISTQRGVRFASSPTPFPRAPRFNKLLVSSWQIQEFPGRNESRLSPSTERRYLNLTVNPNCVLNSNCADSMLSEAS